MTPFSPKHNQDEVLRRPFDCNVHNETFRNYCEVIIKDDGEVVYGTPSHMECLKRIYRERFGTNPDEDCPREFYADYLGWLSRKLEACVVYTRFFNEFYNKKQVLVLRKLQMSGCCDFEQPFRAMLADGRWRG